MSTRKKRPVLYELVSRGQRARGWTTPPQQPSSPPATGAPPAAGPPPKPTAEPSQEGALSSGSVRVVKGMVHLALSWFQLGVLGVFLVVVLVATFYVGRSTLSAPGGGSDLDSITGSADADQPAAAPSELSLAHRPSDGSAHVPAPRPPAESSVRDQTPPVETLPPQDVPRVEHFAFQEGHYYVLVQCFPKWNRTAAEAARDFLRSKNVACTIYERRDDLAVFATEACSTERQAENLARTIRRLGKEYFPIGRYDFGGCAARQF
ncbi:MAG: hypothetical protein KAY37_17695 [Phycisphaerae bacterium]|nr:hypothetical protein [Phycisphaerae bacterium]